MLENRCAGLCVLGMRQNLEMNSPFVTESDSGSKSVKAHVCND